jgi:hypothetical protein
MAYQAPLGWPRDALRPTQLRELTPRIHHRLRILGTPRLCSRRCPFLALWLRQSAANGGQRRHKAKPEDRAILRLTEHDSATSSTPPQRAANASFSASPETASQTSGDGRRFDNLQTELGRSLHEQLHLLLTVSRLVVLQTLVDVLVAPFQHAIDQAGELVGHGRDRFGCAEFAAETAVCPCDPAGSTPRPQSHRHPRQPGVRTRAFMTRGQM